MDRLLILAAAVIPAAFIVAYGLAKVRKLEADELVGTAFMLGAVTVVAAIPVEFVVTYLLDRFSSSRLLYAGLDALFIAAIPEELAKFGVLVLIVEKSVDVRCFRDRIVLALSVSLGFATLENIFYLATAKDWHTTAVLRAVTAVPGHALFGLAMGAFLTDARIRPKPGAMIPVLAVPVILHAAYDFPLFALKETRGTWLPILWLVVLLTSAAFVLIVTNRVLPRAVAADNAAGRATTVSSSRSCYFIGIALIASTASMRPVILYLTDSPHGWFAAAAAFVPAALGVDLIYTGFQRRRLTAA